MNRSEPLIFKPLCEADIKLLHHWFQEPIINQWYARNKYWSLDELNQKYLPRIQGKDNVPSFIIYNNNHPIGFIQYYCLSEHFPEGIRDFNHPIFKSYQSKELVGIDLFLAEQENRGKGLAKQVLKCFMSKLPLNTRAILVDPDSNNHQAIRFYIKAGFQATHYSDNKSYLLLIKQLPEISEDSQ